MSVIVVPCQYQRGEMCAQSRIHWLIIKKVLSLVNIFDDNIDSYLLQASVREDYLFAVGHKVLQLYSYQTTWNIVYMW